LICPLTRTYNPLFSHIHSLLFYHYCSFPIFLRPSSIHPSPNKYIIFLLQINKYILFSVNRQLT
jgi:hypothetical protein